MSERYKVRDQDRPYFITFAVVGWIDVFTRRQYCDLLLGNLRHCQREKGLVIYAWCIMSNPIHLIVGRKKESKIEEIVRDFKKYTSVQLCRAIEENKNEYHPIELSTSVMGQQRLRYVHNNSVEARIVEIAEAYIYSSAKD